MDKIVIHCSATPEGREVTVKQIDSWHRSRGFSEIGYHYVILLDGTIEKGRSLDKMGAHSRGHNKDSIGICYVGGMNKTYTKPQDTRTKEQKAALVKLIFELKSKYGIENENIIGHNDLSSKACPSFDVRKWIDGLKWEDVDAISQ